MNVSDALSLLNQSLIEHQLNDWTGGIDNARRRFGICRMNKKQISLSRHLCELNSDAEVRDTILHEIAHALAWERHGVNCGHDKRWKTICMEVGARPVACFDNDVVQPKASWVLVNRDTGEVYRSYYKRPARDWANVWIRGQKAQTHGKLEVRANNTESKPKDLVYDSAASNRAQPKTKPSNPGTERSNKITRFDAKSVGDFNEQLLAKIKDLIAEHGLQVSNSKARYNDQKLDLTLTFSLPNSQNPQDRELAQRVEFEALASIYNLTADHYQCKFTVNGRDFTLIGFKPNNRKYPVIAADETGQKYKFEEFVLDQFVD